MIVRPIAREGVTGLVRPRRHGYSARPASSRARLGISCPHTPGFSRLLSFPIATTVRSTRSSGGRQTRRPPRRPNRETAMARQIRSSRSCALGLSVALLASPILAAVQLPPGPGTAFAGPGVGAGAAAGGVGASAGVGSGGAGSGASAGGGRGGAGVRGTGASGGAHRRGRGRRCGGGVRGGRAGAVGRRGGG